MHGKNLERGKLAYLPVMKREFDLFHHRFTKMSFDTNVIAGPLSLLLTLVVIVYK